MGEEGIIIFRFEHLRGRGKGAIGIAMFGEHFRRTIRIPEFARGCGIASRGMLCPFAIVPVDLELLARLVGEPPVGGDHGHAIDQFLGIAIALDHEGIDHPGRGLGRIEIGRAQARAEHRRTLEGGIDHALKLRIDAEDRLSAHDARAVDAADGAPDDAEIRRVLQRQASGIGHFHD